MTPDDDEVARLEDAVATGRASDDDRARLLELVTAGTADGDEVPDESEGTNQDLGPVKGAPA